MIDVIKDTVIDTLKLLPFLWITFYFIEVIEHKYQNKSKKFIQKSGKFGPFFGGILGIIPQCGFSVMATNLYITKIISLGTLISIYLSTSDEMLPILLSEKSDIKTIVIGMAASMAAFLLSSGTKNKRYALKNAEVMIHQPLGGMEGQASDMKIACERILKTKNKLNQILASNTNQSLKKIIKDTDRDYYLDAKEALNYGLIDEIL